MNDKDKQTALIDAYIEMCQRHGYDDSQIIEALTDIYDQKELENLGFENFIAEYFGTQEVQKWKCHSCNKEWFVDVEDPDYPLYCPYCAESMTWIMNRVDRLYTVELK